MHIYIDIYIYMHTCMQICTYIYTKSLHQEKPDSFPQLEARAVARDRVSAFKDLLATEPQEPITDLVQ